MELVHNMNNIRLIGYQPHVFKQLPQSVVHLKNSKIKFQEPKLQLKIVKSTRVANFLTYTYDVSTVILLHLDAQ